MTEKPSAESSSTSAERSGPTVYRHEPVQPGGRATFFKKSSPRHELTKGSSSDVAARGLAINASTTAVIGATGARTPASTPASVLTRSTVTGTRLVWASGIGLKQAVKSSAVTTNVLMRQQVRCEGGSFTKTASVKNFEATHSSGRRPTGHITVARHG